MSSIEKWNKQSDLSENSKKQYLSTLNKIDLHLSPKQIFDYFFLNEKLSDKTINNKLFVVLNYYKTLNMNTEYKIMKDLINDTLFQKEFIKNQEKRKELRKKSLSKNLM